jgi:hypothetical protein
MPNFATRRLVTGTVTTILFVVCFVSLAVLLT